MHAANIAMGQYTIDTCELITRQVEVDSRRNLGAAITLDRRHQNRTTGLNISSGVICRVLWDDLCKLEKLSALYLALATYMY